MRAAPIPEWARCSPPPGSTAGRCSRAACSTACPTGASTRGPSSRRRSRENRDGLVGRLARKAWERLIADDARYRQLRVMSRFGLTVGQARELFDDLAPAEVIDNPYRLYEIGCSEELAFSTIDRGLWPQDADAKAALAHDPIDEPVTEPADDRRVRAACIHVLERAAEQGHTLLDEAGLRRRLADLELSPRCDPVDAAFEIAADEFEPLLVERALARDAGRGWQLDRLAAVTDLIAAEVRSRAEAGPLDVTWDWAERIDAVLPGRGRPRCRPSCARVPRRPRRSRSSSAAVSPRWSARREPARPRCSKRSAPTRSWTPAASCCSRRPARPRSSSRPALGSRRRTSRSSCASTSDGIGTAARTTSRRRRGSVLGRKTVVIDEASMLTEEMLAATIDALDQVDRLILCGDPRQLPPIGAGRPFADLVAFLRDEPGTGGGVAELRTGRRQVAEQRPTPNARSTMSRSRRCSRWTPPLPGADEALARVISRRRRRTHRDHHVGRRGRPAPQARRATRAAIQSSGSRATRAARSVARSAPSATTMASRGSRGARRAPEPRTGSYSAPCARVPAASSGSTSSSGGPGEARRRHDGAAGSRVLRRRWARIR